MPAASIVIGAIFDVSISEAQANIAELSRSFGGLDEIIKGAQASLATFGADSGIFRGVTEGLATVGRAMTELGANIDGVAASGTKVGLAGILGYNTSHPVASTGEAISVGGLLLKGTAGALTRWGGASLGGLLGPILGPLGWMQPALS